MPDVPLRLERPRDQTQGAAELLQLLCACRSLRRCAAAAAAAAAASRAACEAGQTCYSDGAAHLRLRRRLRASLLVLLALLLRVSAELPPDGVILLPQLLPPAPRLRAELAACASLDPSCSL
jgi:hypothetical protein